MAILPQHIDKKWLEPFLLFSVLFLPGFILQSSGMEGDLFDSVAFNFTTLVISLPHIGLILYMIWQKPRGASHFGLHALTLPRIGQGILAFLGVYILLIPLSILLSVLSGTSIEGLNPVHWRVSNPLLLPLIFITCLTTGYREEIFFRSYLLTIFEDAGTPPWIAAILSSLLFSGGHLYQGVPGFLVALVLGLYFSWWYFRKRDLHTIALAHGFYNFFTLLLTMGAGIS
jgi:uncharacterized protein